MTDETLPGSIGTAGLTGRADPAFGNPQAMRTPPELEPEETQAGSRPAMPASCLRAYSMPPRPDRGGCATSWGTCPGVQRDGGCLLDIVRAAVAAGVKWRFEVDPHDGYWDYDGDPIPGFVTERRDFGQIHTRWEPGYEPADRHAAAAVVLATFECPHCHTVNTQDPANFHFWCMRCGKNAKERPCPMTSP